MKDAPTRFCNGAEAAEGPLQGDSDRRTRGAVSFLRGRPKYRCDCALLRLLWM